MSRKLKKTEDGGSKKMGKGEEEEENDYGVKQDTEGEGRKEEDNNAARANNIRKPTRRRGKR